ncbi:MAG: sialidase family protein [Limisphaerales bacterium]
MALLRVLSCCAALTGGAAELRREFLPPALRDADLDRLSSGALRLLDPRSGAVTPAAPRPRPHADVVPAVLDGRVGPNVRMGGDPEALPPARRAQAEPHLVRSPLDPDLLLAAFQEGRFTDGGAVTCGYAVSTNGGLAWSRALLPGITQVNGGPYDRATDPVAAADARGFLYVNTLALAGANNATGVLLLSRSTNGGASFEPPRIAYRPPNASIFPDKNWIAVNSFTNTPRAGRLVVTYTRFSGGSTPIALVLSDDGGVTWTPPQLLTAATASCQGSQPAFLPDGSLLVGWFSFSTAGSGAIEVVRTPAGGTAFTPPVRVASVTLHDDDTARDGAFLPSLTVDAASGRAHCAWQGLVFEPASGRLVPRIMAAWSDDGGASWSAPRTVSDNPPDVSVFNAIIAAGQDGRTVAAAWWDKRVNAPATNLVDTLVAFSLDAGTNWTPAVRATAVSTDLRLAPLTGGGRMIGDYFGLAGPLGPDVPAVVASVDTRDGGPDPWALRVGAAAGLTWESWRAAHHSLAQVRDPEVGGPVADGDADGFPLEAEYVWGLDPFGADDARLTWSVPPQPVDPTLPAKAAAPHFRPLPPRVRVTHPRRVGVSDFAFQWEATTNFAGWGPEFQFNDTVEPLPGTPQELAGTEFRTLDAIQAFRYRARRK